MRRITSIAVSVIITTFVACNGGGGGAASTSTITPTLPPPDTSAVSKNTKDEASVVPTGDGFVRLNSSDEGSRNTITLRGQSD